MGWWNRHGAANAGIDTESKTPHKRLSTAVSPLSARTTRIPWRKAASSRSHGLKEWPSSIRNSITGFDEADIVIEAAFESMAVKKQLFAEIDKVAKPDCVLATNTSTLDIDEIASVTSRPEMVIGTHFFSPAHVMRLVEIVRGKATGKPVIATAMALAKTLRKVGVLVGNSMGFVGNRMMLPICARRNSSLEEGATPGSSRPRAQRFRHGDGYLRRR